MVHHDIIMAQVLLANWVIEDPWDARRITRYINQLYLEQLTAAG